MTHRTRQIAAAMAVVGAAGLVVMPPGAAAESEPQPVTVTAEGYWTAPATDALPPTLVNGFPPGVFCLVAGIGGAAELCGEQVQQLKAELDIDGLPIPTSPDGDLPQPIQPNTLPVGQLGGKTRYVSGLRLQLPAVPFGHEVDRFDLVLKPEGLSFAAESPAFRELSVAALSQISRQSPDPFRQLIENIVSRSTPVLRESITGIEACPATEAWAAGVSEDIDLVPDVDCILGSTGVYDAESDTYKFDLKFAAQQWYAGDLANNGIIFRPIGAENLAYGDPDLSTNWTVSVAGGEAGEALLPEVTLTTYEPPPVLPPVAPRPIVSPPVTPNVDPFVPLPVVSDSDFDADPAPQQTPPQVVRRLVPGTPGTSGGQVGLVSTVADVSPFTWPLLLLVLAGVLLYGDRVFGAAVLAEARTEGQQGGALTRLVARSESDGD